MEQETFLPYHRPLIGDEEVNAAVGVLRSGWLTTGPVAARFEQEFSNYTGASHALAVNSATAALHLALCALGIKRGDEVITTPLTFCATVNAILQTGATPVLADVDDSLNIDPARVAAAVTPRTRALLPVHFAGLPCNLDALWRIAREWKLAVVEDAAHAVGASWKGIRIGAGQSDAVAFSFYATKNMTTGEGGMVTSPSAELSEQMRILSLHGMSRQAWNRYAQRGRWEYQVLECGFKYNLSDIAAAIGLVQLARLDAMNARRRAIALAYNSQLAGASELQTPRDNPGHCWHLYVLRLNLEELSIDRAEFIEEMHARGIGCSVHFIPIPLHPYYSRLGLESRQPCPWAMREYPRLVSLPLYPGMIDSDVGRVSAAVLDVVSRHRKRHAFAVSVGEQHELVEASH